MFFWHLKNVLLRQDSSKIKLRCLEDVLRQLGHLSSKKVLLEIKRVAAVKHIFM